MNEQIYEDVKKKILDISKTVKSVIATEKCRIRKVGFKYYVVLHITVEGKLSVKEGA